MKVLVNNVSMTERDHRDLIAIDHVHSSIRRYTPRPDVLVAVELMDGEVGYDRTRLSLETVEPAVKPVASPPR